MVSLYLFGDASLIERLNDKVMLQSLANQLGFAILLPDDDPDPDRFIKISPSQEPELVHVDSGLLDDGGIVKISPAPWHRRD